MRPIRKHFVYHAAAALALAAVCAGAAAAAEPARARDDGARSAGGLSLGEGSAGVTDRVYIVAPPHYLYVIEKESGSFLDCGEGLDQRATDDAGRDLAALDCGVTLTETVVIPAASESARLIIHY